MVKVNYGSSRSIMRITLIVFLSFLAVFMLFPFIWLLMTSIKPEAEIVTYPPKLWPTRITFKAYVDIWKAIPFARFFVNTVVFACGVTIISLLFDSFSAYAFARLSFPEEISCFRDPHNIDDPVSGNYGSAFALLHKLGWLNTYAALIIRELRMPLGYSFTSILKAYQLNWRIRHLLMERQRGVSTGKSSCPSLSQLLPRSPSSTLCITGTTFLAFNYDNLMNMRTLRLDLHYSWGSML